MDDSSNPIGKEQASLMMQALLKQITKTKMPEVLVSKLFNNQVLLSYLLGQFYPFSQLFVNQLAQKYLAKRKVFSKRSALMVFNTVLLDSTLSYGW